MSHDIKRVVDKGVRFLDFIMPDWRDKIEIEKLDMGHGDICIAGQLFGHFNKLDMAMGRDFSRDYGFISIGPKSDYELTKEWKRVLIKTFDLTTDVAEIGTYEVIEPKHCACSFDVGDIVRVVVTPGSSNGIHNGITVKNFVVSQNNKLYINPIIIVKKVD